MITTIIANYNYGSYVTEAIYSALNQTVKNKIIVIDDGSTDDSISRIMENFNFSSSYEWLIKGNPVKIYSSEWIELNQSIRRNRF